MAIIIAYGIDSQGKHRILGVSMSLLEAEVHWREFMQSLVARGLHGVKLIVSDAHAGLKAARIATLSVSFAAKRTAVCLLERL